MSNILGVILRKVKLLLKYNKRFVAVYDESTVNNQKYCTKKYPNQELKIICTSHVSCSDYNLSKIKIKSILVPITVCELQMQQKNPIFENL